MTKNIRTTTKTIETPYWTAIDGKEFETEESCKEYEKSVKCTVNAAFEKIPKAEMCEQDIFWCGYDDSTIVIIKPRNFDDIKIINMYCNFVSPDSIFTQDDINKDIILECCSGDWYRIKNNWEESFINPIIKAFNTLHHSLDEYGLWNVTATITMPDDSTYSITKSGYQIHIVKEDVHRIIRDTMSKLIKTEDNTLYANVHFIISKDGKEVKTFDKSVVFDKTHWKLTLDWGDDF